MSVQNGTKPSRRKLARHRQVKGHPNILWSERASGKKTYSVRYWDSAGRRVIVAVGPRLDQALARQAEITGKKYKGEVVGDVTTTVGQLIDGWTAARDVKSSTADTYDSIVVRRILPRWRNVRARDVTRASLTEWLRGLRREDGHEGPLGEGTKRLILAVFSEILSHAVHAEVIAINPVGTLERKHRPRQAKLPPRILGEGEYASLLAGCRDRQWLKDMIAVTLHQALRIGEVVALRWSDIDWDAGTLTIRRAVDKHGTFGTPKGGKEATIPLTAEARKVLARLWMAAGRPSDGPVFRNGFGGFRHYKDVQGAFVQARRRASLSTEPRELRFHDLRHSAISRLANAPGAILPQVQRFARHANLKQTMEYIHVIEDNDWAEQADAALAGF